MIEPLFAMALDREIVEGRPGYETAVGHLPSRHVNFGDGRRVELSRPTYFPGYSVQSAPDAILALTLFILSLMVCLRSVRVPTLITVEMRGAPMSCTIS